MSQPSTRYVERLVDRWLVELLADVPAVMVVGPRAGGKTTTASRLAQSVLRLDQRQARDAVDADPDSVLASFDRPLLVDEWQLSPEVLGAAKRSIDVDSDPGQFLFTGSAVDDAGIDQWPGTGRVIRLRLWGLTRREIEGTVAGPSFVDRLIQQIDDGDEVRFALPVNRPDIAGYVDRALDSGFPEALNRTSVRTRQVWLRSYIDHLVGRDVSLIGEVRQPGNLRRYLRALAVTTGGVPSATTLAESAAISRVTAERYDRLLERLFVVESVPAWASNRLSRVARRPKRYVTDPAIAGVLLGADRRAVLRDGDLLGKLVDTFVAAQLRPELEIGEMASFMYHLRQQDGRREVDLIIERADGALVAIEIKASSTVNGHDARHLVWLRDQLNTPEPGGPGSTAPFRAGIVFYGGEFVRPLSERVWAVPICALWA